MWIDRINQFNCVIYNRLYVEVRIIVDVKRSWLGVFLAYLLKNCVNGSLSCVQIGNTCFRVVQY